MTTMDEIRVFVSVMRRDDRAGMVNGDAAALASADRAEAALLQAVESVVRERDEARKLAAEGRKAGRAEAAAILMAQEAESFPSANGDDALVESYEIGDTGDYGTSWIPEKVLDLFDATDSEMTSVLDRLEGGYWEAVGRKDDADDARRRAESALAALRAAPPDAMRDAARIAWAFCHEAQQRQTIDDDFRVRAAVAFSMLDLALAPAPPAAMRTDPNTETGP